MELRLAFWGRAYYDYNPLFRQIYMYNQAISFLVGYTGPVKIFCFFFVSFFSFFF